MAHTCHFPNCQAHVAPKLWGCSRHWFMLPQRLRGRIWREYRPGQEDDKRPSRAYVEAAKDVQAWILENLRGEVTRLAKLLPPPAPKQASLGL
jgi:hypothetical protein